MYIVHIPNNHKWLDIFIEYAESDSVYIIKNSDSVSLNSLDFFVQVFFFFALFWLSARFSFGLSPGLSSRLSAGWNKTDTKVGISSPQS